MFQYCLPQLRTPPLGSHSRSPSALAGKQHCFFAYCSALFSVCEVSIVHHRAKQIWTLQGTRSVCVSVCMCMDECVCVCLHFLLWPAHAMQWLIPQHWLRINLGVTAPWMNTRISSLLSTPSPSFFGLLLHLSPSKHKYTYAFMHTNNPSKVKGIECCLFPHQHVSLSLHCSSCLFWLVCFGFVACLLLPDARICTLHRRVVFQPSKLQLTEWQKKDLIQRVIGLLQRKRNS